MSCPWPDGVDYDVWRIMRSKYSPGNPNIIHHEWSLEDVVDAHIMIDLDDELELKAALAAQR